MSDLISSVDAVARSGVSYRQLDYWVRCGAVTPAKPPAGTGSRVGWTPRQVRHLEVLARIWTQLDERHISNGIPHELAGEIWTALEADEPWAFCIHITADGRLLVGEAA